MAVSADGERWFLLNASPDVLRQVEATVELCPGRDGRGSPIAGVVLTSGDLDHCLGLLLLREWTELSVVATRAVFRDVVERNVVFRTLARSPSQLRFYALDLDEDLELCGPDGRPSGLAARAYSVAGTVPLHLQGIVEPGPELSVGLVVTDVRSGSRLVYTPNAASTHETFEQCREASALFFDGTFWSDDELRRVRRSDRTAREMGHLPLGGEEGSLAQLRGLDTALRVLTHINNTNPILDSGAPERHEVERRGWAVAEDGWRWTL